MAAENQPSGRPPVQHVHLSNIAWMNCKLLIDYDRDPATGNFKKSHAMSEIMKDQSSTFDLSGLENIKPLDVIRVRVEAVQAQTAEAIRYNKNNQTAHYQFSGTLFKSWLTPT
jgi:hypothetical protein